MAQSMSAATTQAGRGGIAEALSRTYSKAEARMMNPLTLAYIGDVVYSDYIRRYLVAEGLTKVDRLTKASIHFVRASAQARAIRRMLPELTDEERSIVRRGRNTKSMPPKHADVMDYRYATGLEALFGYLDLTGSRSRELALMTRAIELTDA
ncbi:MAG: Mini-ribonuclease 3 [Pseudoramibacter sp.]